MKAGDLVFVWDKGLIPDVIRLVDTGKFNHVAIAVNETQIIEAEYNTNVHVIDNPYTNFEVVPLNLGENSKIDEFVKQNVGKKYDFLELIRVWLRIKFGISYFNKFNNTKEVICSELAGDYLEFVGIAKKGEELLAPNELYRDVKSKGF